MEKLVRFGISMEEALLRKFDNLIREAGYKNRSEAFRDLARKLIVEKEWNEEGIVAGSIILVYSHHRRELVDKLMDIQHHHHDIIISTQHIHFDDENCFEVIVFKGRTKKVKQLYNFLASLRGMKYSNIAKATTGKGIL